LLTATGEGAILELTKDLCIIDHQEYQCLGIYGAKLLKVTHQRWVVTRVLSIVCEGTIAYLQLAVIIRKHRSTVAFCGVAIKCGVCQLSSRANPSVYRPTRLRIIAGE
jgi:hypothetical protein